MGAGHARRSGPGTARRSGSGHARRSGSWRTLAGLVLVCAPGLVLPTAPALSTRSGSAAPDVLAGTPVLSVRRLPQWIESVAAAGRLEAAVTAAAGPQLTSTSTPTACAVVVQGGRVLYSLNPRTAFLPASTLKILTALAVLDRLGPGYRLTTNVAASGVPRSGVVYGNLYLEGGGDPLLRTASYESTLNPPEPVYTSLDQLARRVRDAGVTEVTGSVVGDDSRYDAARSVPTWKPIYLTEGDVAPLSALEVNDDAASAPPKEPTETHATPAPYVPPDPPAAAAASFLSLLRRDGIEVAGGAVAGLAPAGAARIASIEGPPLSQEVDSMLTYSDDTAAELLTKELGLQVAHSGSTDAGTAAVRADLAADGLDLSGLVNLDGSGLDRGDRVTCSLIVAALDRAGPTGVLAAGLPVAGKTGTLAARFLGTPAVGRLKAKTGTLIDVAALSGFVTPAPGQAPGSLAGPLTFAIVVNGMPYVPAQDQLDRIGVVLAKYPQVPPLSQVSPGPAPATELG